MQKRSSSLDVGAFFATLGGVVAIIGMAINVKIDGNFDALGQAAYYLLVAVVFFAVAGGFRQNGQWPMELMIIMSFAIMALAIIGVILEVFGPWFMVAFVFDALVSMMTVLGCLSSSIWFGTLD
jgi:hypothetical protein